MRRGLFGGTFSPFHNGHLYALRRFREDARLDAVTVMPAGLHPCKGRPDGVSDFDRLVMTRLAVGNEAEVSDYELNKETKSYTVETLSHLRSLYPDDELWLYMGSDALLGFENTWYRFEEILHTASLYVLMRTEADREPAAECAKRLADRYGATVLLSEKPSYELSSTEVRRALPDGASEMLDEKTYAYIIGKGLYGTTPTFDEKPYLPLLQKILLPDRYAHSLGVADTAAALAAHYGTDVGRARAAGLLHDVTKNMTQKEQLSLLPLTGYVDDDLLASPGVWHAFTGAYYAEKELSVTDPALLSMIRRHTAGCAGMTTEEKILYIADFIEPHRTYSNVDELRVLAFEDLDRAALEGVRWCIERNLSKNYHIYRKTVEYYNDLLKGLTV